MCEWALNVWTKIHVLHTGNIISTSCRHVFIYNSVSHQVWFYCGWFNSSIHIHVPTATRVKKYYIIPVWHMVQFFDVISWKQSMSLKPEQVVSNEWVCSVPEFYNSFELNLHSKF